MPAPTNIDAANAIEILTLPFSTTQVVDFAGVTYTVWYKYTFAATGVIGVWGFGDLAIYTPELDIYGPNSSVIHSDVGTAENVPAQLSGVAGEEFFFKFTTNAGNPTPANLAISVLEAPDDALVNGALMINDDTPGFPGAIIDPTTGAVLKFITPFPAGEFGDSILTPTPYYAVSDADDFTIKVYDVDFVLLATLTPAGNASAEPIIRSNKTLNKIYTINKNAGNDWILQRIDEDGSISAALATIDINLSATFVSAFCMNNAGTKVYINDFEIIKVWDIAGVAFDADLLTYTINYKAIDILVMDDDSIVILFVLGATGSIHLVHVDSTGAILNDYDFGTGNTHTGFQHITYSLNHPDTVWMWTHPFGAGTSRFREIQLSDGTALVDFTIAEYETGVYLPSPTATPTARFGISFSCPFFMISGDVTPPPVFNPLSGIYQVVPGKRNDTLWESFDPETTEDVKIPDPYIKSALFGK